jgi:nitroalkane oxidase
MQTIARRDGDEWVITGEKHYTTNGTGWDKTGCALYTVVCRTDPAAGADDALAVIAVPGAAPGITVADVYDKIGHRGVVTPRVHFDQVRVPAANLIGQPGRSGKRVVAGAFNWTAALIGAACVGTMRAAFEYALDFARTEKRLGTVPVIEHQNVGFMLADIKMRIEACDAGRSREGAARGPVRLSWPAAAPSSPELTWPRRAPPRAEPLCHRGVSPGQQLGVPTKTSDCSR